MQNNSQAPNQITEGVLWTTYCCSITQLCLTLCNSMDCTHQASLSFTISQSLLMSVESVMPSNRLVLCRPLLLLPSIFPSIRVFSNELALCIRWPKYCSSTSVLLMNIQGWLPLWLTGLILQSKGQYIVFINFVQNFPDRNNTIDWIQIHMLKC